MGHIHGGEWLGCSINEPLRLRICRERGVEIPGFEFEPIPGPQGKRESGGARSRGAHLPVGGGWVGFGERRFVGAATFERTFGCDGAQPSE